jgi:hypothetical protein
MTISSTDVLGAKVSEKGRLKNLKKIPSSDRTVTQLQNNIEQALNPFINAPINDGVLIKDACLVAGATNDVTHKLGRKPIGWIVTRRRHGSHIWDMQDTNPQPTSTLSLGCTDDVTIDIWIF